MRLASAIALVFVACSHATAPAPQQPPAQRQPPAQQQPTALEQPPAEPIDMERRGCLAPGPKVSWQPKPEVERLRRAIDWGAIYGHVTDGKGPLPGIQVMASKDSQSVNEQLTDEGGYFRFIGLKGGDYELTYRYGSAIAARKTLTVTAGASTNAGTEALQLANFPRVPRCM